MKYLNFLLLITIGLLYVSCTDFLDKTPLGVEAEENFFKTESQCLRGLTAVYDVAAWSEAWRGEFMDWVLGDICSDDAVKGGGGPGDFPYIDDMENFRSTPTIDLLPAWWRDNYQGIYRANLVVERVPNSDITDATLKNRIIAEAKFLRGHFYFNLVKTFGGVPLILKPLEPAEYQQPRNSATECWAQIEKDFSEAAAVLPTTPPNGENGRATKGAALAYLTKAYIFQAEGNNTKWQLAFDKAKEVIDLGVYSLLPKYEDNFKQAGEFGSESIFEYNYVSHSGGGWGNANEGSVSAVFQGPRNLKYFTGWGFNCPTTNLDSAFEAGDTIRPEATIVYQGELLYPGTPDTQTIDNAPAPTLMMNQKAQVEHGYKPPDISGSPNNRRIIRYADLLLFHAEAANKLGNDAAAQSSLNLVRARVGLPAITTTGTALLDAIRKERRVELAMEGHRFFDVVRQGRGEAVFGKYGFKAGIHEVFPIPQSEIDACPLLKQNPGY